jgi:hypothetical protein
MNISFATYVTLPSILQHPKSGKTFCAIYAYTPLSNRRGGVCPASFLKPQHLFHPRKNLPLPVTQPGFQYFGFVERCAASIDRLVLLDTRRERHRTIPIKGGSIANTYILRRLTVTMYVKKSRSYQPSASGTDNKPLCNTIVWRTTTPLTLYRY